MEFSPAASRALRDAYFDLYMIAARLFEGSAKPAQARAIRAQAEASLKGWREKLFRAGVPESWVNEVQMPVVGLVDEAARKSPAAGLADNWPSLQYPMYGHELVGRIAFEHLEKLRANPDTPIEVLEIYARCLALGFQGEYYPHRLEDLKILLEGLKNELNRRMGAQPDLAPALAGGPALAPLPRILRPQWIAGLAIASILAISIVLTIMLSIDASQAEKLLRQAVAGKGSNTNLPVAPPTEGAP